MIGRDVELGEIVIVELDIGAFGDREAEIGEDRTHFVEHLADRMDAALGFGPRGQGDVDALGGQARIQGLINKLALARRWPRRRNRADR